MSRLRFALLLVVIGAAGGCHGGEHAHVPDDADTDAEDAEGTPDDSGKMDARPADAGDAGPAAD
jgi:hypothetical protein